ncbi:nucleoside hydrolase [Bacillaceae bacterium SIJ1]|uniref:nucleoside hydrolase n=1 Tax=Litoribacterium kuwaitense TaxID=1398745 RepID=UPI0013EDA557|nr:nucleoside hydrolase [Litoribacterium kuwaitense]NGP44878.1 nucleoside hydrolase [Litoribacterium kuwaitense]
MKVIMDVDTGIDDAIAISLMLGHPSVEMLGLTTVSGNVPLEQVVQNTRRLCTYLDASIPIYIGASKPLCRQAIHEHHVHGGNGLGGVDLPDGGNEHVHQSISAAQWMCETVTKHPHEVTLLMTGPLTNLALALAIDPDLPSKVHQVVFMGGAAQTYGNITPLAEFNIYVDPEAAKNVVHAGFRSLTMVGLDVTRQTLLTPAQLDTLPENKTSQLLKSMTAHYMKRYEERNGIQACAMHDPLAAGAVLWPDVLKTTPYYVDVETNSELCDGQTVCDIQERWKKAPNVDVATAVDAERFMSAMLAQLANKEESKS